MAVIEAAASKLTEQLHEARAESDRFFGILKPEALYERPIAERHRVIFYVGHLEGFDAIRICREALGVPSPDSELDALFQAGIDPDSGHLPSDTSADWPSLEQVKGYVRRCRRRVDECLERAPEDVAWMALEHRQMHLETLAYMFHNFGYESKTQPGHEQSSSQRDTAPPNDWREIPGGEAVLGKARDGAFGWDNEYEEMRVLVPAFRMQRYSVSNGDYLQFVKEGATQPHFWTERNGAIFYRGMFEEIPLPLDWPVYVTQKQAEAYATWLGKDLPTEEQFHRAAYGTPAGKTRPYPWGNVEPTPNRGNFDFRRWNPEAVDATPDGDSAFGISQLVGNGWEWTRTPFGPLPGFRPHEIYPGYSANFFDDEHYVIKGGSSRTAARLLRSSFRNWFRRDYAYVYATFRCVEN
ncbi:MAG TPA: SUMF1/EgtB/PvdO family nonheme iron enzyme [Bryobacteraceae bacterium]|jgi:formylglycine-generating enzyme required for sulfatase activity|nr:SUMF1/EgtB/PvdO family nonheme iron enzyme [Bryobacteraceae bacterium]